MPSVSELSSFVDPKSLRNLVKLGGVEGLERDLQTNLSRGLNVRDEQDFQRRQQEYGKNSLPQKPPKTFLQLCWLQLHDRVLIILTIAAVVSLALGLYETFGQPTQYDAEGKPEPKVEWVEGLAIMVAVFIIVVVSAANDYNKERQFMKLNAKKEDREIVVFRGGEKHVLSILDLLVGDIINVETGDVLPADAVLVSGRCECDESSLTGETATIKKVPCEVAEKKFVEEGLDREGVTEDIGDPHSRVLDPILISGSQLLSGQGKALVTAVGVHSMHGKIMMSLRHENEVTPLQKRLEGLTDGISKYGFMLALLLFTVLFIRFCVDLGGRYSHISGAQKGSHFLDILITAITIVVVAIPEGLPLAVTLALAFATGRMMKDGNLVRVLKSCETMGSATAVCSDKTGTLTLNKMRVVKGFMGEEQFDDREGKEGISEDAKNSKEASSSLATSLHQNIANNILLNSTAFQGDNPDEPFVGSKTECALLLLARDSLESIDRPLQQLRDEAEGTVVQRIPFESSRKWGGLVVKTASGFRFYIKGASEMVFSRCGGISRTDGSVRKVDAGARAGISDEITQLAGHALRTISLAHRDLEGHVWPPKGLEGTDGQADVMKLFGEEVQDTSTDTSVPSVPSIVVNDDTAVSPLVLDSIVGIQDPLRPGVATAIEQCRRAGVRVRMVTGDNVLTAKAISLGCGILSKEDADKPYSCMEGPKFRLLSEEERFEIVPQMHVLARSSPEDKRVLVETLKKLGEVVAVTGDGTNDAPALKLADVGFSMGIAGTEVAREASDIILMNDDFGSIVNAIKWGRTVSTSIRKFVQFQLTVNVTACVLTFVSAVASADGTSVLTAVQLLWVNLIMDTLAALALATDKPDDDVLNRKPMGRQAPLISTSMWKMIMGQATMQLIVTLILHFVGDRIFFGTHTPYTPHEVNQVSSLTFNTFVWLQVFKLVVTRKLDEGDGLTTVRSRISRANLDFFQHLFRNYYFIAIEAIICGFQVLIMFVGGAAFSVTRQTGAQWGTALVCGLLSFPVGWIVRITPDIWVEKVFPTKAVLTFFDWLEFGPIRRRRAARKAARKAATADEEKGDSSESGAPEGYHAAPHNGTSSSDDSNFLAIPDKESGKTRSKSLSSSDISTSETLVKSMSTKSSEYQGRE